MTHGHGTTGIFKPARRASEGGFVLVWTALLLLPVLTLGFILISYGQANISKLRAQFNAMNLAAIGTTSVEFNNGESLRAMTMLARAQGLAGAQPVETVQNLSNGLLIFNHDTDVAGESKVAVYLKYTLPPLTSLVSSLGNVATSGVSRAKPSKLFVSVALDYSRSLLADHNISDLLRAFGVIDGTGAVSTNGESRDGQIYPIYPVQNALPFSIATTPRYWHSWNTVGAAWPDFFFTAPNTECIPGPENGCGGSNPSHIGALMYLVTNHFIMYKRAATILLGVLAQHSRYIDVNVLGAPLPTRAWEGFLRLTQPHATGTPPPNANFEPISLTANALNGEGGVFPVWRYDEPTVTDIQPRVGGSYENPPMLSATVEYKNSFDQPKNLLTDDMSVSPTRLLFLNVMTAYRKALTYLQFQFGNDRYFFGVSAPPSGTTKQVASALRYFLPAIPSGFEDPGDSLPHYPGALTVNGGLQNEVQFPFGWPGYASPPFSLAGPVFPSQNELPEEIKEVREYRVHRNGVGSGPAKSNLAVLSKDTWKTGYGLCLMLDREDDNVQNNSIPCNGTTPFDDGQIVKYYQLLGDPAIDAIIDASNFDPTTANLPTSPSCPPGKGTPRCKGADGAPFDGSFPWCVSGWARCAPFSQMPLECYDEGRHLWYPNETVSCTSSWDGQVYAQGTYPAGYYGLPEDRGSIIAPSNPPPIEGAHLLYFLMDLLPTYGGTFHQNSVPLSRCDDFRNRTGGTGRCAFVMVTDGVPNGRDFGGGEVVPTADMIDRLGDQMDIFTDQLGGRSFTWYLGKKDQLDSVIEAARRGTLSPEQKAVIDGLEQTPVVLNQSQCTTFDSISWTGINCLYLNEVVIPSHLADEAAFSDFKNVMDGGTTKPSRAWVETELSSDQTGAPSIGSDSDPLANDFLKGLRFVLALIKGTIVFDR